MSNDLNHKNSLVLKSKMVSKKFLIPILLLIFSHKIESASLFESSYEYVLNLGKNFAPSLMSILDCMGENEAWSCAREKAGKILDGWSDEVDKERRSWQEQADAEVRTSGRSLEEMPSKIGEDVENTLGSLADMVNQAMARAFTSRKKHDGGGIDSITISTGGEKKKMKKKKQKPPKIHLVHPIMVPMRKAHKQEKGRNFPNGRQTWVIGDKVSDSHDMTDTEKYVTNVEKDVTEKDLTNSRKDRMMKFDMTESEKDMTGVENDSTDSRTSRMVNFKDMTDDKNVMTETGNGMIETENGMIRKGRGINGERGVMNEMWSMGEEALDILAEHALEAENKDNGIQDKSSFEEQRGKKKKKKKAILKLLILGAVLKAKIGTLLQILSFKLQVKFFIVAVLGLAINLARLWIDLKNKHSHQPQKVIYYEHAQHQHHYDHEEEPEHGWGPWSRSMEPEEQSDVQVDMDFQNSPYRAQEKTQPFYRPQNI